MFCVNHNQFMLNVCRTNKIQIQKRAVTVNFGHDVNLAFSI